MPFQSYAQAAYLKHRRPDIYSRWAKEYGKEPVHKVLHVGKAVAKSVAKKRKGKKNG